MRPPLQPLPRLPAPPVVAAEPTPATSFQPAFVAVQSTVLEKYDPARPNDYETTVRTSSGENVPEKTTARERWASWQAGTFVAPREDDGEGEIRGDDADGKRRRDVEGREYDARIRFAVEAARGYIRVRDP